MTTTKWFNNRIDYNTFYSSIEELFSQFGPPYGAGDNKIIPNGFFWSSLAINVLLRSREYSANATQNQCSNKENEVTVYSYIQNETTMMMLGLIVLSWLKVNLKKKTENGDCYNPIHKLTATTKPAIYPFYLYHSPKELLFDSQKLDCTRSQHYYDIKKKRKE